MGFFQKLKFVARMMADPEVDQLYRELKQGGLRLAAEPAMWETWELLVWEMSVHTELSVSEIAQKNGLTWRPKQWQETVAEMAGKRKLKYPDGTRTQQMRFLMGGAMDMLRGRIATKKVAAVLTEALEALA